jgi:ADP-ribose pyrophosphatase YjhB (NUDIX family)
MINSQLDLIKRIKSLTDAGLVYAENEYDVERYEEIRAIGLQLLSAISNEPLAVINDFFLPVKDYPTPKVDIRALVLNKSKEILFVKEKLDNKWSLPGGWGEIGFTPSEVIRKEIKEETGLDANVLKLLAIYDKKCHPHPPQPFYVYKIVFLCEIYQGTIHTSFDIEEARYFDIKGLPNLSEDRILKSQIEQLYQIVMNTEAAVYFD